MGSAVVSAKRVDSLKLLAAIVGALLLISIVAVVGMSVYHWKAHFQPGASKEDRKTTKTPSPTIPPGSTYSKPPTGCEASYTLTGVEEITLLQDGKPLHKWTHKIALVPWTQTGKPPEYSIAGKASIKIDTCVKIYYVYVIHMRISPVELYEPTTTPTVTSTYAPPNIQPPNRPPIAPLSIGSTAWKEITVTKNGSMMGEVVIPWKIDLNQYLKQLQPGRYEVKVWTEFSYISADGAHRAIYHIEPVDVGVFSISWGGGISYEG